MFLRSARGDTVCGFPACRLETRRVSHLYCFTWKGFFGADVVSRITSRQFLISHSEQVLKRIRTQFRTRVLRIRIRDPVSFWPPGSGIHDGYKIKIQIRDEHPISYFRDLRKKFLGKQIFNSFWFGCGPGIRNLPFVSFPGPDVSTRPNK